MRLLVLAFSAKVRENPQTWVAHDDKKINKGPGGWAGGPGLQSQLLGKLMWKD